MTVEVDNRCPWCERQHQAASGLGNAEVPDEGSVSLCWGCYKASFFMADGSLRKPTDEEQASLDADPEIRYALYSLRESTRPQEAVKMFEAFDAQRRKDPDGKHKG